MNDIEQSQVMTRRDLEAKIIAKAWKDEGFRQKFLTDPKGQFEEHLGTRLPETLVMTAHQEDANHLYFVIPARPQVELDELSDEDLEKVAGGVDLVTILTIAGTVSLVGTIAAAVTGATVTGGMAGSLMLMTNMMRWGK